MTPRAQNTTTLVAVFLPKQPIGTRPAFFLSPAEADWALDNGAATRVSRHRIRMTATAKTALRGESCQMSGEIMERLIDATMGADADRAAEARMTIDCLRPRFEVVAA